MPIAVVNKDSLKYHVDLVMCIDGTGSMAPVIKEVKDNAKTFYQKFIAAMEKKEKKVQQLRIKVIVFRDIAEDSEPLNESPFFTLGDDQGNQTDAFVEFVDAIEACGGGDIPENSLEALALAIKSDWVKTGSVRRHVIMMFTDAPALELGTHKDHPNYPAGMPGSIAELREMWESQEMEERAKRMILYAPDGEPWSNMIDWTNTFHSASRAGTGLTEVEMETCIHMLVNSI